MKEQPERGERGKIVAESINLTLYRNKKIGAIKWYCDKPKKSEETLGTH